MHSFEELTRLFLERFEHRHFPETPASLYDPAHYFLGLGGKRIRPVTCLMGNELFDDIIADSWHVATAIELFHNFTLIHDDIMDKAPLRRGMETVHTKYGDSTALLAGDVMLVVAYDHINKVQSGYIHKIMYLFNKTAREVCEGQQLDMDFEKRAYVSLNEYIRMIELKTSVLLAASLQMGAVLGGAGDANQHHLYEFGRNLGIAFQVQDDYLDAFGDPKKFGKQVGGDILSNKKTFLMIHALETATASQKQELVRLMEESPADKVEKVLNVFRDCGVDEWALRLKQQYLDTAIQHLEDIAVLSARKEPLKKLASFLIQREH
ncbi:polyprenyl synthetase family protein [Parasegetibacter sp. NRK P23]|uniref:polyprenyl synthetase family protein n=1 Tax=Parasegetibacter sp. NRK P23 TaxID=2942999 RepID=UPI002042D72B|nr:polyprenyl synthetase family protein [Parasegetibacter sp. NRK P23]MCM5528748.1 polyprenyl synthetase family protein [Parasegetibacter sp. NRK P23]